MLYAMQERSVPICCCATMLLSEYMRFILLSALQCRRFCSKSCESTAAERGHIERCVVIRRLPAPSEALKKTMLDNCVLDDESLSNFCEQSWLGDENIEFYWDLVATHLNPTYIASDILFVPPAAVMLAHFLTAKQLSEPDNFGKNLGDIHKMQLVIMAVNNAEEGLDGGTHWGCLTYCRPLNQFRYYDSMRGQNSRSAKAFAEVGVCGMCTA